MNVLRLLEMCLSKNTHLVFNYYDVYLKKKVIFYVYIQKATTLLN